MARVKLHRIFVIVLAALGLLVSLPAAAQYQSEGYTFLQAVKNREGTEATELLRKPGSTVVNARDISSGETGLHLVAQRRDLTWMKWLIQEGANPNVADKNGITPLIIVTRLGWIEGIAPLIEAGANVDVANNTGETPLIAAVHARNIDLIEALLAVGANPDRTDNTGRSARDYANERGTTDRVALVIQQNQKSDADKKSVYGPSF